MNGVSMPDEEKQFEAYKKAAIVLKGKTLTIRTLDVGGDKNIPYMGLAKETNPFLGYRAIRFCLYNAAKSNIKSKCIWQSKDNDTACNIA